MSMPNPAYPRDQVNLLGFDLKPMTRTANPLFPGCRASVKRWAITSTKMRLYACFMPSSCCHDRHIALRPNFAELVVAHETTGPRYDFHYVKSYQNNQIA
jgi:hypothetical protein